MSRRFGQDPSAIKPPDRWIAYCARCGKHCYLTRTAAKRACRALYPGDPMSTYRCGPYWHYGHNYRKRTL